DRGAQEEGLWRPAGQMASQRAGPTTARADRWHASRMGEACLGRASVRPGRPPALPVDLAQPAAFGPNAGSRPAREGSRVMDIAAYEIEAEIEGTHWWFAGRRRLFAAEIERVGLDQNAAILDLGTSTGTNLRMLRSHGFSNVQGLDASDEAIRFCLQKGFDTVRKGD